jgi:hypothetical protein
MKDFYLLCYCFWRFSGFPFPNFVLEQWKKFLKEMRMNEKFNIAEPQKQNVK